MINQYLNATGPFEPNLEGAAPMKFALACMLSKGNLRWISWLIDDESAYSEFEDESGWNIMRRNENRWQADEFRDWPSLAVYRAYVDPDQYLMKFPECFMSKRQFFDELAAQLKLYSGAFPSDDVARELLTKLAELDE